MEKLITTHQTTRYYNTGYYNLRIGLFLFVTRFKLSQYWAVSNFLKVSHFFDHSQTLVPTYQATRYHDSGYHDQSVSLYVTGFTPMEL
jgi:hypothetical protein